MLSTIKKIWLYGLSWRLLAAPHRLPAHESYPPFDGGAPVMRNPPEPVPGLVHWQRIAGILEGRIDAAHLIVDRQSKALTQLDAAEFALSKIVEDLSTIMPIAYRRSVAIRQPVRGARKALAA